MTTIPEPDFIERDPKTIEQQVFATWESFGGDPLEAGQVEALFLKVIAYRESLLRMGIQDAAKANLLRFSKFPIVDYIGELLSTPRLPAASSLTTLRWSLAAAHGSVVTIEAGTRARSKDGRYLFATLATAVIAIGQTYVDVAAQCTLAGAEANGYTAGQVTEIFDAVPPQVTAVTNLTTTRDGSAPESTAAYIERLLVAPDAKSSAGSTQAYRYFALSASSAVADVAIISPDAGDISIAVLSTSGAPSPELLALVAAAVNPESVRPLTDTVTTVAATGVNWTLTAALTLYANADGDAVLAAAQAAAATYTTARAAKLHRSAPLSQITAMLSVSGVFEVALTAPSGDVVADADEWLNCTAITITIAGYSTEVLDNE